MKLAEIVEGEEYWVSINESQVEVPEYQVDYPLAAHVLLSHVRRGPSGIRARILEVGVPSPGDRKYVRVEVASRRPRRPLEYTEDNLDGTRTEWRGWIVDEEGKTVEDEEETFTALIAPQQVVYDLHEGIIHGEMLGLDSRLRRVLADG